MKTSIAAAACGAALLIATSALAAAPAAAPGAAPAAAAPAAPAPTPAPPIGNNITLEQAKQVVAAAEAEATKRGLKATIAIVDTAGTLVYYQKATGAPYTAWDFSYKKAVSAARNRRQTKFDADRAAAGNPTLQYAPDIFPFAGGVPIVLDGKLIGAIGETGGADQDVALAGAAIFK